MNPELPSISCLVLSARDEHHKLISSWLGMSKQVGSVTAVRTNESLCQHLSSNANCNLCIIVVDSRSQSLPACTERYPATRILVISTSRKSGKLSDWRRRGANDAVRIEKTQAAQHAVSRLIDECVMDLYQQSLKTHITQLEQEIVELKSMVRIDSRSFSISASNDKQHSATHLIEADLNCMEQPVIENIPEKQLEKQIGDDSAIRGPARTSVMKRFQKLLHSDIKAPRFTAMLVRILSEKSNSKQTSEQNSVQELTLDRAADALQKHLVQGTILGRVNRNALLLIQSSDIEPVSRDAANRVREALGSLGGLINSDKDVRINTMTLPAKTRISVDEVVARLEAH